MKLFAFSVRRENRIGETIAVTVGFVKAKDDDDAENIISNKFMDYDSFQLTIEEVKDDVEFWAYDVERNVFK